MSKEQMEAQVQVTKVRLEKFNNDKDGNPIRENGPEEIWEGSDESNMKCIYNREEENNVS